MDVVIYSCMGKNHLDMNKKLCIAKTDKYVFSFILFRQKMVKAKVKPVHSNDWENVLKNIYYKPGKSGAFGSATILRDVLFEDYGIRVSKAKIQNWLEEQHTYTRHRNRRLHFKRNPVIATHINNNWQCDIGFLDKYRKNNRGFSNFLACIDVLSRKGYAEPMKSKDMSSTSKAFSEILKRASPNKPEKLQTDRGKEFYNRVFQDIMKKNNILLFSTQSDKKAAVAERFIKTLKEKIRRYMDANQTNNWVSIFPKIVQTYNSTPHKTIGMKPDDVNESTMKNAIQNSYGDLWKTDQKNRQKFKIGDRVRVSELKKPFKKGYEGYWSPEIFKILKINNTKPYTMYELGDIQTGEKIVGDFYAHEISRVIQPKEMFYQIEKILKREKRNGEWWNLIKFVNYAKPEWLPESHVTDAKNVRAF